MPKHPRDKSITEEDLRNLALKKTADTLKNGKHVVALKKGDSVIYKNCGKRYTLPEEKEKERFTKDKLYTLESQPRVKLIPDHIIYFFSVKDDNGDITEVRSECFDW